MDTLIIFGAKYLIYIIIAITAVYVLMQEKKRRRDILIFAVIVLPFSYILAKLASLAYYDPRPFVVGPPAGGFAPLIPHVADNGFPSDHTLLSSAIAMTIFPFSKKIGAILFALALVVGFSRVLAGVHHSVDILASAMIAMLVCYVTYRWIMPRLDNKS